jgi:hypothetical protein
MARDNGHFAKYLEPSAHTFLASLAMPSGTDMLDVACGPDKSRFQPLDLAFG